MRNWILTGHESELAENGDFKVINVATESAIIVRGQDGALRAFANVCRHRGSVVCREEAGNKRRFECPYHAWVYDTDGTQVGHTRLEPEFGAKATVRPPVNETLSIEHMIRGYTINGAAQLGMEDELGSIEVGKSADLVVLDRNLFETLPTQVRFARPTAVLMEGDVISGSLP